MAKSKHKIIFDQTRKTTKRAGKKRRFNYKKLSKNQKKEYKAGCMHSILIKDSKIKNMLQPYDPNSKAYRCRVCGEIIRLDQKYTTKKEAKKSMERLINDIGISKWVLQNSNIGDQKAADFFERLHLELLKYTKISLNLWEKSNKEKMHNDKKKRRNNRGGGNYNPSGYWNVK